VDDVVADRRPGEGETERARALQELAGPAHVATVSFLASRAAPSGGFWIGLAGGVALARAAQRRGAREGYGASIAAMLETVAIMGPARFGVPLTQAASAPLLGRLQRRGVGFAGQLATCMAIRLLHNTVTTVFFIWIITGGVDAYAGAYHGLAGRFGIELTTTTVLALTGASLVGWAAFASTVQVLVYRRGLRHAEEAGEVAAATAAPGTQKRARARRFDPRAVALAAVLAFALLLTSTAPALLAGVAVWLVLAWALARPDREPLRTGLALAALLAGGSLIFTLGAGLGAGVAARRAVRAALLVLVATWLRAAAGAEGLRELSRRTLGRLSRVPAASQAAATLEAIGSEGRLLSAGRSLLAALGAAHRRPLPLLDAVLDWVARESASFRPTPAGRPPRLRLRAADAGLLALALAPAVLLL
jgi:hypothetical protein